MYIVCECILSTLIGCVCCVVAGHNTDTSVSNTPRTNCSHNKDKFETESFGCRGTRHGVWLPENSHNPTAKTDTGRELPVFTLCQKVYHVFLHVKASELHVHYH